jgi:hypothetical protein
MTFETASMRSMAIVFGLIAAGAAVFLAVAVFPATNLVRDTITVEGIIVSSSNSECVVDTPDEIPKVIKNCNLEPGTKVTVSYQEGLFEATIVPQP